MSIGSLFAGIGGLELGLEAAGLGHVSVYAVDPGEGWQETAIARSARREVL